MPPCACSIRPGRAAAAPVNAPRAWPNSSFSSSDSVSAAQFRATNGFGGAAAAGVNRPRHQLLAGAGLAGDQHRARSPHAARAISSLTRSIGGLDADQRADRAGRIDLALQEIDLARQLTALGRRSHPHQQLVAEERLLHEIDRAELHRLDRGVDGAEAGHDDERGIDAQIAQLPEDVEAGDAGHAHVGQDDVVGATPGHLEAFLAARRRLHGVPGAAQRPLHAVADARVVVYQQNPRHRFLT